MSVHRDCARWRRGALERTMALCTSGALALALAGCQGAPAPVAEAPPAAVAFIRVQFSGITPAMAHGTLHVALWKDASSFMKEKQWLQGNSFGATMNAAPVEFAAVPAGTYAVSAFIDTTDCGQFRRGPFGMPIDPWAVSGGGPAWMPPSWNSAAFQVKDGCTDITLDFSHGAKR